MGNFNLIMQFDCFGRMKDSPKQAPWWSGYIKINKEGKFKGLVAPKEAGETLLEAAKTDISSVTYINGAVQDKIMKFTELSPELVPVEYTLIRTGITDFYGSSREISYIDLTNPEYPEIVESGLFGYNKVVMSPLLHATEETRINNLLGALMYKHNHIRPESNKKMIRLMNSEDAPTITDAINKRNATFAKTLLKQNN